VGAEPFYCVNFESDGRKHWAKARQWGVRSAGPKEATEWVDYCNNPSNKERKRNGAKEPFNLKLWQLGNETSYDPNGFDCETTGRKTIQFAKAMRKVDPDLQFIGWGDTGWAPRIIEIAGEHLQFIAYHTGYRSTLKNPPFGDWEYQEDPDRTWAHLMTGVKHAAKKLKAIRQQTDGSGIPLALTESHYGGVPGRNRGNLFGTWAMGVSYARIFNLYQRNGDALKIATLADFCGTRWMNNAIMMTVPGKVSYMLPVARVMSLFRHHTGRNAIKVTHAPEGLDVTASRTGKRFWLHVANTKRTRSVKAQLKLEGLKIASGRVFQIAVASNHEVFPNNVEDFKPVEKRLPRSGGWTFPGASVTAMEIKTV
jgi:alpha-L-arabinofuranosidase